MFGVIVFLAIVAISAAVIAILVEDKEVAQSYVYTAGFFGFIFLMLTIMVTLAG